LFGERVVTGVLMVSDEQIEVGEVIVVGELVVTD